MIPLGLPRLFTSQCSSRVNHAAPSSGPEPIEPAQCHERTRSKVQGLRRNLEHHRQEAKLTLSTPQARCRTPRNLLRAQRHPLRQGQHRSSRRSLPLARCKSSSRLSIRISAVCQSTNKKYQANVMLAYPIPEAVTLLASKLESAKASLGHCEEDLDFLREQITVSPLPCAYPQAVITLVAGAVRGLLSSDQADSEMRRLDDGSRHRPRLQLGRRTAAQGKKRELKTDRGDCERR